MLIFFYVFFSLFIIYKFKISTPLLFIYSGFIYIFGILSFSHDNYEYYLKLNLLSNLFILIGFFFGKKIFNLNANIRYENFNYNGVLNFFLFSVILITIHYSILGIPILSENFDVIRFSLSSSGYGGVPSRIAIYTPMMFFFIWIMLNDQIKILKGFKIGIILFVLLALIFQGHKSSILQMFFGLIISYQFIESKNKINIWIFLILIIALIFAYISFINLSSINNLKLLNYLFDRYTVILHESGFTLFNISKSNFSFFYQNIILSDFMYPILKFLNIDTQTLNDQLSRFVYGVFYKEDFSVPVTPGWFAYHYFVFDQNIYYVLILSIIFGVLLSYIENYGINSNNFYKKITSMYLLYFSYVGYSTGNIYYLLINLFFCIVVFTGFYFYVSPNKIKNI